ncbi:MAG: ester cyclase [Rhodobacteraceae bacterium]|nr:ester cyclase [Paracoccaceae bacterium]
MADFQAEKQVVLAFYAALDAAEGTAIAESLARFVAPEYLWRGPHPFHEQTGPKAVAELFWQPLHGALSPLQRRLDIFMAGRNALDGGRSLWVVSMGHLMGLFRRPWLGIPATGKMAFLRYCAFHRVAAGKIHEEAMFFDIPQLMRQAGVNPFPPQTGAYVLPFGPQTHDGLMFAPQDPAQGQLTLEAIERMVSDLRTWRSYETAPLIEELRRSWCENMIWWGPTGIGSAYTIEGYARQHAGPFRATMGARQFVGHIARIAEGAYGGFFGWPNLRLKPVGGFMGMPATGTTAEMRVIDIYRRHGSKLAENWVFIDLLHFWNQQGLDILARMAAHEDNALPNS